MTDETQKTSAAPILYGVIFILLLVVGVLGYLQYQDHREAVIAKEDEMVFQKPEELTPDRLERIIMRNCQLTPYKVDGTSMQPAYRNGSTHVFHTGEKCPFIALMQRDRVALLNTGRVEKMVMKFVKGLPGDKFALSRRPGRISVLTVNGKDVKNSAGQVYKIERSRQRLLDMYVRDYKGVIPANAYLLLGDNVQGSLDSTQFGLVHVNDISGVMRAEKQKKEAPKPKPQPRVQPQPTPVPQPTPQPVPEPVVVQPEPTPEPVSEEAPEVAPEAVIEEKAPETVDQPVQDVVEEAVEEAVQEPQEEITEEDMQKAIEGTAPETAE